jgi:precorrin-2 dehydrogenase/sirohydrochlorin ferrochelatase
VSTFIPLNLRIDGRRILFIGGGALAMHKLQSVLLFTGDVTVLAPDISMEILSTGIHQLKKSYAPSDLDGFFLIYACSEDDRLNHQVLDDAQAKGILCNIVDNRRDSDFISPALFRHDGMTVAISSDGRNARRSVEWRNAIKDLFLGNAHHSASNI